MKNLMLKNTEQWIDLIANKELPAITSTAIMLDKFSNDDKSSLPKLSHAILHDQALSSCLLKVANSVKHIGVNKITTVSRASVVLGIQAVKNICLTAKLVDSLLASKSLDYKVYNRLLKLMTNSFYAGMLAKMMLPHYSEELQEEVYLAALLYTIGETAFWSCGGEHAEQLAQHSDKESIEFKAYCEKELGTSFNALSRGLAKTWNLSDLLYKALDEPENRTNEIKTIFFADKLSALIADPGDNENDFVELLENISKLMNITVPQLKIRIESTRKKATSLLNYYGAEVLIEHLNELPETSDFEKKIRLTPAVQITKETMLLAAFIRLTGLLKSSRVLNEYLRSTIIDCVNIFKFDRCSFLMMSDDKTQVTSRFVYNNKGIKESVKISFNIRQSENVIDRVLETKEPVLINDYTHREWRDLCTKDIVKFIEGGALAIIPVKIGNKVIGVLCAQYFFDRKKLTEDRTFSDEGFEQLCSLIEHLNTCLTMITMR